jgi:predicted RNA-binding Zn-ribbon protein involved in translation (DUF1610 family)
VSEWFQTIADVEATAEEAEGLAAAALAWLVESGIVVAEETDCTLDGPGHAPGPNYATAVTHPDPNFLTLHENGLSVVTGQTVFFSMGADEVTCPQCGQVTPLEHDDDAWQALADTIGVWYDGGSGDHPCPACGKAVGLNEWTWSPPWGFGYLGLKFWNWPELSPQFLAEVSRRLGHRTVHPCGKM